MIRFNPVKNKIHPVSLSKTTRYFLFAVGIYSVFFAFLAATLLWGFHNSGTTSIENQDAMNQHFNSLLYIGQHYRYILKSIADGHPVIPQLIYNLNLGSDASISLAYYGLYDPIAMLSTFFPVSWAFFTYNFVWLTRLYLTGISFVALGTYLRYRWYWVGIGALVYVGTAFPLVRGVVHPFFLNATIFLPLLMLAINRIFRYNKGTISLALVVFGSLITGIYFAFDNLVASIFYFIVLFISQSKYRNFKKLKSAFARCLGGHLIGLGLAAVAVYPTVIAFLDSSRSARSFDSDYSWFPDASFYSQVFNSLIAPIPSLSLDYNDIGIQPIALVLATGVFFLLPKNNRLFWYVTLAFILFGISFQPFSSVMNLGSYVIYRWFYIICFVVSIAFVEVANSISKFSRRWLTVSLAVIAVVFLIYGFAIGKLNLVIRGAFIVFYAVNLFLLALPLITRISVNSRFWRVSVISVLFGGVIFSAVLQVAPASPINQFIFISQKTALEHSYGAMSGHDFYKTMSSTDRVQFDGSSALNAGLLINVATITGYFSLMNKDIVNYNRAIGNSDLSLVNRVTGENSRPYQDAILSIKYSFCRSDSDSDGVSLYSVNEYRHDGLVEPGVCKNRFYQPFGLFYDHVMRESDFYKYSYPDRERLLLHAAVMPDNQLPKGLKTYVDDEKSATKVELKRPTISYTNEGNAILHFDVTLKANKLYYFEMVNGRKVQNYYYLKAGEKGATLGVWDLKEGHPWAAGVPDSLVNLGSFDYDRHGIELTAIEPPDGSYFSKVKFALYEIDLSELPHLISQTSRAHVDPGFKVVDRNTISGSVNAPHAGILMASVQYSKGWTATVDGRAVTPIRTQVGLVGIPISGGVHEVVFRYHTPGLFEGAVVSLVSLLLLLSSFFLPFLFPSFPRLDLQKWGRSST